MDRIALMIPCKKSEPNYLDPPKLSRCLCPARLLSSTHVSKVRNFDDISDLVNSVPEASSIEKKLFRGFPSMMVPFDE